MNPQQVARAGEMFVAAEIHRRGGYAVTFAGNMPGIDILASDLADTRRISIQVKAKSSGSWHARFPKDAAECSGDPAETSFWVFVDLGGGHPAYFVARGGGCATTSGKITPHTSPASSKSTVTGEKAPIMESRTGGSNNGVVAGTYWASFPMGPRHKRRAVGREAERYHTRPARVQNDLI